MRLLRKYGEKSHRSIIKVSFLAKNIIFDAAFCLIPRYKDNQSLTQLRK